MRHFFENHIIIKSNDDDDDDIIIMIHRMRPKLKSFESFIKKKILHDVK